LYKRNCCRQFESRVKGRVKTRDINGGIVAYLQAKLNESKKKGKEQKNEKLSKP